MDKGPMFQESNGESTYGESVHQELNGVDNGVAIEGSMSEESMYGGSKQTHAAEKLQQFFKKQLMKYKQGGKTQKRKQKQKQKQKQKKSKKHQKKGGKSKKNKNSRRQQQKRNKSKKNRKQKKN